MGRGRKNNEKKMYGKNKQYTGEKLTRLIYIAGCFRKGWSKPTIQEHIAELWGITRQSAAALIVQTYKYLDEGSEEFVKNLRRIQLERLEYMLEKCIADKDYKTANSVADTINKTFKLYEISTKVEIVNDTIKFKFDSIQGDENKDENEVANEQ